MSPSPDELLMLLANNDGQPPPVENFTVEHKELGKIHWLVPVLPWKLDLDKIIKIGHLVVEVRQLSGTPGQGWSDAAVGRTAVGKMQLEVAQQTPCKLPEQAPWLPARRGVTHCLH